MKQLGHLITLKKCHFCKTRIDMRVSKKDDLVEYRCLCGKAHGYTDDKDLNGNSTLQMLEGEDEKNKKGRGNQSCVLEMPKDS